MDDERSLIGPAFGTTAALGTALVLVPLRRAVPTESVALILVFVVVAAAFLAGRRAGFSTAFASALALDFFHTRPYGSLKIADPADLEVTVLLLGLGLVLGTLTAGARQASRSRRDTRRLLTRMHAFAQSTAEGVPYEDLSVLLARELVETLQLRDCYFERAPFLGTLPTIADDGGIVDGDQRVYRYERGGFALPPDGAGIVVRAGGRTLGRFVLIPRVGVGLSWERRVAAVTMARQFAAIAVRT